MYLPSRYFGVRACVRGCVFVVYVAVCVRLRACVFVFVSERPTLQAVGLEGFFGTIIVSIALVILYAMLCVWLFICFVFFVFLFDVVL